MISQFSAFRGRLLGCQSSICQNIPWDILDVWKRTNTKKFLAKAAVPYRRQRSILLFHFNPARIGSAVLFHGKVKVMFSAECSYRSVLLGRCWFMSPHTASRSRSKLSNGLASPRESITWSPLPVHHLGAFSDFLFQKQRIRFSWLT